jgi:hypothetical protein
MGFNQNIRVFRMLSQQSELVDAYRMLIAIELVLKNASGSTPNAGHNIPAMLTRLASTAPVGMSISGPLNSLARALKTDLNAIVCQGKDGHPCPVPDYSYPYMRYTRFSGDWGGSSETPLVNIKKLEATCHNIISFLSAHKAVIGVVI